MGEKYLKEYMSRLGWGSGFNLPIANDENRQLEKELEAKQRKVMSMRAALDDEERRGEDLKNHFTRTSVLMKNMEKMGQTQRGTMEHARRLKAGAENTLKNLMRDLKWKKLAITQERTRHGKVRMELEKRQVTVYQLSAEIEWDNQAIAAVRNSSKEEESDIEMMSKYFTLDENAIKEGELAYRKMKQKEDKLKAQLETRISQVKNSELTLNRVCNQFRAVHKSRNDAVELWKGVIESLKMRDADLQLLGEEYVNLTRNLQDVAESVKENESMLKTNAENTGEVERSLRDLHKTTSDLRQRLSSNQSNVKTYEAQLISTRLEVQNLAAELKKVEKRKANCEAEVETILERENQLKAELDGVRVHHKKFKFGSSSTDEKFRQLGVILDFEEEQFQAREKERDHSRHNFAQLSTEVLEIKTQLESIRLEMKGKTCVLQNTKGATYAHGIEIEKRQRKLQEFEFTILTLQGKIMNRSRSLEDYDTPDRLFKQEKQLRQALKEGFRDKVKQESLNSFTHSVVQGIKKEIQQFTEQGNTLDAENDNLNILLTAYKREGVTVVKLLHQTKFDFQMILLTRNRLVAAFQKRKQKYFSATKNYLELEAATGERQTEIRTHMVLLEQRKKNLTETRTRLVINMSDIQSFLRNLKTKYEMVMTAMSSGTAESDGVSEAYLIIKFAQERETLKHEGETWDRRVKEAEREVEGLQNTLALLRTSNQNFKTSLTPQWKKSSNKTATLTEKLFRDFLILKHSTEQRLHGLLSTCQEKERELHRVQSEIESMRDTLTDRRQELTVVLTEIGSQKTKIDRAKLLTRRLLKQMEELHPEERDLIESEIKLKCLREKFEFSIKTLTKTVESFPALLPWILDYFKSNKAFAKLALKLQKQESVDSISGKESPATNGSKKPASRTPSRQTSATSLQIKEREAQRVMSAASASSSSSSVARKLPKSATPPSRLLSKP